MRTTGVPWLGMLLSVALVPTTSATAWAAPPSLPTEDAPPADDATPPAPTVEPPADTTPEDGDGSASAGGSASLGEGASVDATGPKGRRGRRDRGGKRGKDTGGDADDKAAGGGKAPPTDKPGVEDDPGFVQGRREPMMTTQRGPIGLFHTSLPDVGGLYTFRFHLTTDFFRANNFFVDGSPVSDTHARVRGGVNLGFTFTKWTEVYFNVRGAANRNERNDPARQDPNALFALGDMDFGIKGAWRGVKGGGIGVGGQMGLGLLSSSDRLLTDRVNFNIDGLFAVDLRYLTKKRAPVRLSTNLGWMLDNSNKIVNWGAISDLPSREVLRFGLDANNSRFRMRYGIDFPFRVGKRKGVGIDPLLEWSWDVATGKATRAFIPLQDGVGDSPLPRSQMALTLGARVNVVDGLFLSGGVDIGMVSPNFAYGPRLPVAQGILGIGWSFDPKPRTVEVEKPVAEPEPISDGRVMGRVLDSEGNPIADAKVRFPGAAPNAILTDGGGGFTSYRFPAGVVSIQVELADGTVVERQAEVVAGQDVQVDIQLEGPVTPPGPPEGVVSITLRDAAGAAISGSVHVKGEGIDEPFDTTAGGKLGVALPVGAYTLTANASGLAPKSTTIVIEEGQTYPIDFDFAPPLSTDTPNVSGSAKGIRLKKAIRYSGDAVDPASNPLLDELASFMLQHPEFELIEIRVHTDDKGNPTARSQARADAVKRHLTAQGVADARVEASGFGAREPIAVNITADGRRKNNRTQVLVKRYAGK